MNKLRVLSSNEDASVNFVQKAAVGYMESRYVRRSLEYVTCYLSSQSGCNRGCGFCHLTATGQTMFQDEDADGYVRQAQLVLQHYDGLYQRLRVAKWVNFDFMARGEPLANTHLLANGGSILQRLAVVAQEYRLPSRFNVSTIMPRCLKKPLIEVFGHLSPVIYYSMQRPVDLHDALGVPLVLSQLTQRLADRHGAGNPLVPPRFARGVIDGENDTIADALRLSDAVSRAGLVAEFNLVRYNPPESGTSGRESSFERRESYLDVLRSSRVFARVKEVTRVGRDVKASCGMFVDG